MKVTLAPIPTDAIDLYPTMSQQSIAVHHDILQAGYIDRINHFPERLKTSKDGLSRLEAWRSLAYNLSGAALHKLYWDNLSNQASWPSKELEFQIKKDFGSLDSLINEITEVGVALPGDGWVVLAWCEALQRLILLCIDKHQNDIPAFCVAPILVVDVWEHAYYLDYMANKRLYLKNIWGIINWLVASDRFNRT